MSHIFHAMCFLSTNYVHESAYTVVFIENFLICECIPSIMKNIDKQALHCGITLTTCEGIRLYAEYVCAAQGRRVGTGAVDGASVTSCVYPYREPGELAIAEESAGVDQPVDIKQNQE